uniref:Endoplasmic reticulum vesicle transporter C-terminal domain-containing protein n=1 Tax=Physcomitrium patens TaxID=3218 RepID=A0A7I4BX55_PHYPA
MALQMIQKLKSLDAYPKINEDFYSRTLSGGIITIISATFMVLLFFSELKLYLAAQVANDLVVDTERGGTIQINLDVTFPALACSVVSLDAMDISGEAHLDVKHNIFKKRLDVNGKVIEPARQESINQPKLDKPLQKHGGRLEHNETYCGSCFGAETEEDHCCNNCEEVREAYRKKGWALNNPDLIDQCKREGFLQKIKDEDGEGCNVYGTLEANKVAGNFHFAPGKSFQQANMHVHDLMAFGKDSFNVSHKINEISFGVRYPGAVNPLDKLERIQTTTHGMYQYFIKVVPTVYTDTRGRKISTNQVKFTEKRMSFFHFLTNVCAIVGGVFSVSGIIDAFVYHGQKQIKKRLGKDT